MIYVPEKRPGKPCDPAGLGPCDSPASMCPGTALACRLPTAPQCRRGPAMTDRPRQYNSPSGKLSNQVTTQHNNQPTNLLTCWLVNLLACYHAPRAVGWVVILVLPSSQETGNCLAAFFWRTPVETPGGLTFSARRAACCAAAGRPETAMGNTRPATHKDREPG